MGVIVALILLAIILAFTLGSGPWSSKCATDGDCLPSEVCVSGECKLPTGGVCTTNSQCLSGMCTGGFCASTDIPSPTPVFTPAPAPSTPVCEPVAYTLQPSFPREEYLECYDDYSEDDSFRPGDSYTIHSDYTYSEGDDPVRFVPSATPAPIGANCTSSSTSSQATERGLLDAISYSDSVVFVYKDGRLRTDKRALHTRLKITSLALYNGYLIVLARGKVYRLLTSSYARNDWLFEELALPLTEIDVRNGIIRISSPLDGSVLSIQTSKMLYTLQLHTGEYIDRVHFPDTSRRVYGPSADMFIDVDLLKRRGVDWNGKVYENIIDAVINYEGKVTVLSVQTALANGYSGVRIVNWVPYFLLD